MTRRTRTLLIAMLALACAGLVSAENYFLSVSATTTSATKSIRSSGSVMICNASASANIAYVRLFDSIDVMTGATGAATNAYSDVQIAQCKTWPKPSNGSKWEAVAILSAGTSTVTIDAE